MALLTTEDRADIEGWLRNGETQREIAYRYGCARSTIGDFIQKHGIVTATEDRPLALVPDDPTREEKLEQEVKELRRRASQIRTTDVLADRLLDEVREMTVPAAKVYEAPEEAEGEGQPHVQALLLSDLHAGEVVNPEAVNGLNEYNWDICVKRMESIHKALCSFQNNRPYPIDELQIWCLGDMNSGRNHSELAETNEFPVAEQSYRVGMLMGQFIEGLVEHFPKIKVVGVAGNHPRTTIKPANKQVFDNFDWLSGKIAEIHLSNYDSVECNFPRSGYVVQEIGGMNFLLFHGDGIRSTMPGVPWGGVMRRVNELKKQYAEQDIYLDGFALGHFHQANAVAGQVFMNGSVKGLDEYTLKQFGSGEKPTQLLLTVQRDKRRITDVSYITP